MYIEHQTTAKFLLADGKSYQEILVPPGDRDPATPTIPDKPAGALGVVFYDQVVAEVNDPATGDPITCYSEPFNESPGWYYYRGIVANTLQVSTHAIQFPILTHQNIEAQMKEFHWTHIIYFEGGKVILPFFPDRDVCK